MKHRLAVADADAGARVDRFVLDRLSVSRAQLKALFEGRRVTVNGRAARKGDQLAPGQVVEVSAEPGAPLVPDERLPLVVLHEGPELVVVDKPAGVPSHPQRPGEIGTVASALAHRYPEMVGLGDDPREAGLVHRLDVETSGVLAAVRTRAAWERLRAAFSAVRQVDKRYLALVSGPLADEGTIELPLVHAGDHVRPQGPDEEGRPALSHFEIVRRRGRFSLVEVQLVTGVLHQVRAHLAAVGAPIVGDTLYGGEVLPELSRFFLHASRITVEGVTVSSPLPPELARAAAAVGVV